MPWLPKNSVVVPIDFSDEAFAALDTVLELVASPTAIHALHVLPIIDPAEPGVIWTTVDNRIREKHALDALAERLTDTKYSGLTKKVAFGDAGHQVAEYAMEQKAELIVVSSHGRTGIRRVAVSADFVGVMLVDRRAADHDLGPVT